MNDADKGLASKKPNHQGHTLLLNSRPLKKKCFHRASLLFALPNCPIQKGKKCSLYNLTLSYAMLHQQVRGLSVIYIVLNENEEITLSEKLCHFQVVDLSAVLFS